MTFDDRTQFPDDEYGRALKEETERLLDDGKLSKLLEGLHSKEVTKTSKLDGSGVRIAFIDQGFDKDMSEFKGRVVRHMTCVWNEKDNRYDVVEWTEEQACLDSFHGNTAADLAVGKECGVAPNAEIYFFEVNQKKDDKPGKVEAILNYIRKNEENLKLDIISFSAMASQAVLDIAGKIKEEAGSEFIDSRTFWPYFIPGREANGETIEAEYVRSARKVLDEHPELQEDEKAQLLANPDAMAFPAEGKTSIQIIKKDGEIIKESRKFNGAICGTSFVIPQLVGYLALAKQINPDITLEKFIEMAKRYTNSEGRQYIKPIEVVERIWEEQREVGQRGTVPTPKPQDLAEASEAEEGFVGEINADLIQGEKAHGED